MKIDNYNLYCEHCMRYRIVSADMVTVTMDLDSDRYCFETEMCPGCDNKIKNNRLIKEIG